MTSILPRGRTRVATVVTILSIGLLMAAAASIALGPIVVSLPDIVRSLLGDEVARTAQLAVREVRLPRVLMGTVVGGMLAVAGALLQMILRNPLAGPELLGVTSGAVLAAVVTVAFSSGVDTNAGLPLAALLGGLVAAFTVFALSRRRGSSNPVRLILTGVLVGSVLSACSSMVLVVSGGGAQSIVRWLIGSLELRTWDHWGLLWPYALVCLVPVALSPVASNLLQLGDDAATGLGLRVERARILLLLLSVVLTAGAVAVAGAVGFVGFASPHVARLLVGGDGRRLLYVSALVGSIGVVVADLLARSLRLTWIPFLSHLIVQGSSTGAVPMGAYLALLGSPYLLFLIYRSTRR